MAIKKVIYFKLKRNSLIVIIRLMLSVWVWPKVISLSGFHCTIKSVIELSPFSAVKIIKAKERNNQLFTWSVSQLIKTGLMSSGIQRPIWVTFQYWTTPLGTNILYFDQGSYKRVTFGAQIRICIRVRVKKVFSSTAYCTLVWVEKRWSEEIWIIILLRDFLQTFIQNRQTNEL